MDQSFAVWLLIVLALVTANLPFLSERHFLILPWYSSAEASKTSVVTGWIWTLVFAVAVVVLGLAMHWWIAGGLFTGSGLAGAGVFLLRLAVVAVVVCAVFAWPGLRLKGCTYPKPFAVRFTELLVFYALLGVLGFALEASMGNPFAQTWEFYAITFSLFLVLAYPGFVFRYMLRRRTTSS